MFTYLRNLLITPSIGKTKFWKVYWEVRRGSEIVDAGTIGAEAKTVEGAKKAARRTLKFYLQYIHPGDEIVISEISETADLVA